jgi:hypothetical protein
VGGWLGGYGDTTTCSTIRRASAFEISIDEILQGGRVLIIYLEATAYARHACFHVHHLSDRGGPACVLQLARGYHRHSPVKCHSPPPLHSGSPTPNLSHSVWCVVVVVEAVVVPILNLNKSRCELSLSLSVKMQIGSPAVNPFAVRQIHHRVDLAMQPLKFSWARIPVSLDTYLGDDKSYCDWQGF